MCEIGAATFAGMQTTHKIPGGSATTWSRYLISPGLSGRLLHPRRQEMSRPHAVARPREAVALLWDRSVRPVELQASASVDAGPRPAHHEPIRPAGAERHADGGGRLDFPAPKDVSASVGDLGSLPARADRDGSSQGRGERAGADRARGRLVRRKNDGVVRFEKAGAAAGRRGRCTRPVV